MRINGQAINKRLDNAKSDRGRLTVYISKSLFQAFKMHCGEHSASAVLEELMKEYISTTPGPHRAEYKKLIGG